MEPGSFTSEPQYQRPDQRNSDIDYIRRPEPVQAPAVVPGVAPVVPPTPEYGWDPLFASGFYRCKVYRVNDTFLWSIILLFGGIGQCTAGFLEYCKGRTFPSALYLTYGFYCLSHYAYYIIPDWFRINQNMSMIYNYTEDSICCFYSAWVVLSFGFVLASAKTNVLYILQCITAFVFFLLRAAGEGSGSLGTKRNAAGILQAISGFFSLLICFSQILNNETFGSGVFPTCPLDPNNEIDVYNQYPPMYAPPTVPVATGPVVPVATAPVVPVATAPVQPPIV